MVPPYGTIRAADLKNVRTIAKEWNGIPSMRGPDVTVGYWIFYNSGNRGYTRLWRSCSRSRGNSENHLLYLLGLANYLLDRAFFSKGLIICVLN